MGIGLVDVGIPSSCVQLGVPARHQFLVTATQSSMAACCLDVAAISCPPHPHPPMPHQNALHTLACLFWSTTLYDGLALHRRGVEGSFVLPVYNR